MALKLRSLSVGAACALMFLLGISATATASPGKLTLFFSGGQVRPFLVNQGEHFLAFTDHLISGGYAETKCKKAVSTGTAGVSSGATSIGVHPEYSECTAFGQAATITTTGCDFVLKLGTPTAGGWHVTTDIVCTGGSVIKIVTGTCEVTIGGQTGLVTSEVTNTGGDGTAMDALIHTNITGMKYTVVKDNIGCPLTGTGSFSKGDMTNTTTVTATDFVTHAAVGITFC